MIWRILACADLLLSLYVFDLRLMYVYNYNIRAQLLSGGARSGSGSQISDVFESAQVPQKPRKPL